MSYVQTRDLLQRLLEQHNEFVAWAGYQAEGLGDDPLHIVAARVADDAVTRRDALRDALERSDTTALETQIQYENRGAPDEAIAELPKGVLHDPEQLIGAVSAFWKTVLDQLDLLAREASGSGAEDVYKRLASDTERVVASEAWSARLTRRLGSCCGRGIALPAFHSHTPFGAFTMSTTPSTRTLTGSDVFKLVLAVLLPPLGVLAEVGLTLHFWLNIVLTILGYIPGIIHAVYIIVTRR